MTWQIPLFKIFWDDKDVNAATRAITRGMYWTEGPKIEEFERKISKNIGTKYCIVFNSGTSALHAAVLAHGIKSGDEVIVPSFTFIATANAPLFVGAKPVFADIEEETFGLDHEDVKEKITNKTKAIIPVHYGGCPCKIKELKEICEDHNLILIEDAAEAFGAKIKDKKVGTFGDSAMFSFCQNKIITTGEGGAILTDSEDVNKKLKLIRSHGRLEDQDYFSSIKYMDYTTIGYNFRMSNITAALGIAQLKKADDIIEMRRKNSEYLITKLKQCRNEKIIPKSPKDYYHVYQLFTIRVDNRDELMKCLASKGIMTKIYFPPVHSTDYYKNELGYICKLPVTEEISSQVMSLPMYPTLQIKEMDYIAEEIKRFIEEVN